MFVALVLLAIASGYSGNGVMITRGKKRKEGKKGKRKNLYRMRAKR